ncbi:uncharacterized protein yc1106_09247 [Curvularia clavata]|uniref:Uncharacterized protein n=1 Tax=Curvularia clavata TaxID=95742 RepID=A0A9Q8ZJS7_CURCL|nr:uncharacterized protein yc1106_09247 [Curvularia clavata]
MKVTFITPAFIGTAFAAVSRDSNGPCAPNSESTAPAPLVNTLAGFYEWHGYNLIALNARVPTGYETTLVNGDCAISSSKYMLYSKLETYDVQACADICDVHRGCDAFNIYVQREPSVVPGAGCPNPKAIFTTICALYSEPVSLAQCTNAGQYMGPEDANGKAFRTAVRASNIYTRLPAKDAAKVVTIAPNVLHNKQNLHIETLRPSETTTAKEIDTVVSNATILQSIPTAISTLPAPTRVSAAILLGTPYAKPVKAPISEAANTPAPAAPVTTVALAMPSAKAILQAKLTTLLTAVIPQASLVSQITASATVTPSAPSANEMLQSKIANMLADVIPQASSVSQVSAPTATQSSAPTGNSTTSAVKTHLPVQKRWSLYAHRHGIFNKP